MHVLYLILPCYNEEEVLQQSAFILRKKMNDLMNEGKISPNSKILFINDGSKDSTWHTICKLVNMNSLFCGISLAHNVGHQNALMAGLMTARKLADIVISIDADLQQDIDAIDEMIQKYNAGCDIVYGIRNSRNTDSVFKKSTALAFYKVMKMLGCNIIKNHADYRLMSKKALDALGEYHEINLFLRGLIPLLGFQSDIVYFDVQERSAGKSKYTLSKMISLALNGITSFSIKPIRFITFAGFTVFFISIIMIIYSITMYLQNSTVPGWTSSLCANWFIGGLQLLGIGIIGEYIEKIYMEVKRRPRYIIEDSIWEGGGEVSIRIPCGCKIESLFTDLFLIINAFLIIGTAMKEI